MVPLGQKNLKILIKSQMHLTKRDEKNGRKMVGCHDEEGRDEGRKVEV